MSYKGGAGKDFFSSQTCPFRLLIAVFGLKIMFYLEAIYFDEVFC
jgi:hypothetical protein